jgi:hypothetical protein
MRSIKAVYENGHPVFPEGSVADYRASPLTVLTPEEFVAAHLA